MAKIKVKVKTTKDDYAKAVKELCIPIMASTTCLVAQAVKRVTGRPCRVGCRSVFFDDNGDCISLTEPVSEAIRKFDHAKTFTEVEFEMELEPVKK